MTRLSSECHADGADASMCEHGFAARRFGDDGFAEAVVAGSTPDLTDAVRADVGKRMEGKADGKR